MNENQLLELMFRDFKVFMDTCSLMNNAQALDQFFFKVAGLITKYNNKIIVPVRVVQELQKHSKDNKDKDKSQKAIHAINAIRMMKQGGLLDIRGEENDPFADNLFQTIFTKFRLEHNLVLITQDVGLSRDILNLRIAHSVTRNIHKIMVAKFDKNGRLINFQNNQQGAANPPNPKSQQRKFAEKNEHNNSKSKGYQGMNNEPFVKFRNCTSVTKLKDTRINVKSVPGENDSVRVSGGIIRLLKKISSGGEGTIYETNTQFVAKIYRKEVITVRKIEKIKLLLSKKLVCKGICFPVEAVYNLQNEFVGYLMPRAQGKEMQKTLFIKPCLLKNFPNWKKEDMVELALTILKKIKFLHDCNIIMGDINPANILVKSSKEVWFVDTDSYQVEDFPCPVGTINYTAPEIQKKHFSDFLRTRGNENFAVATLLFMLMLPGKPPYSQQGGEDPISNIINMNFSYPFGESTNHKTPDGPWRYIWSHLMFKVKEAFYKTFSKGETYANENNRLNVDAWIDLFITYRDSLHNGVMQVTDPMSAELYPTRFKRYKDKNGNIVQQKNISPVVSRSYCLKCGEKIDITERMYEEWKKNGKAIPTLCFRCLNNVVETRSCVSCGKSFNITHGEYEYFKDLGFEIPKRCPICRKRSVSRTASFRH